jgi:hypothetical protein
MSTITVTVRGTDKSKGLFVSDIHSWDEDTEGGSVIHFRNGASLPVTNTYSAIQSAIQAAIAGTVAASYLQITDGVTAPGALSGVARIYVDSADGDLKVVFADGFVRTIGADS